MNSHRLALSQARRIVVKVGSRVLIQPSGRPDMTRMRGLVNDLVDVQRTGREVVLVSSGAVGAGLEAMGLKRRPTNLPDLQMAAAIGQTRLMARYAELFGRRRCRVGQVLLTHDGLKDRRRHLNARNTVLNLLRHGAVPVVNENDAVSVDEIRFGDNDLLAALVAHLVHADLLVLLTVVNGLRAPASVNRTRRVSLVEGLTDEVRRLATGSGSHLSVGGMATKLEAAQAVVTTGGQAVIADGRKTGIVSRILTGADIGTLVTAGAEQEQDWSERKRWIAFFHRAAGSLSIDAGARTALVRNGKSLLPIGITRVSGKFQPGDLVLIKGPDGKTVARGLTDYASDALKRIAGHRTSDIAKILGCKDYDEAVHRDNMVVLAKA